jgi:moderate conductance mechanosensitive channel
VKYRASPGYGTKVSVTVPIPVPYRGPDAWSLPLFAEPSPSPGASGPSDGCLTNDLCAFIYRETNQGWLADTTFYLLVKPFRILMIAVIALILRYIVSRLIRRLTRSAGNGRAPSLLRPLRERMPETLQEATGLRSERRRQRAEALGSVLGSVASLTIFAVAAMMILGELGVNLAPLIASAGIAGLALGFGAQNLVKDFIAGLFMLLEDQYGVGDVVDVGEANGTVEAVGLRITTIRDVRGVLWYIRNGEIVRVGNKSQGWALIVVDVPVGFAGVEDAVAVLREAAAAMAEDPEFAGDLIDPPEVLGVEQITVDGAVVRTTIKTASEAQWRVGRELRRRLTEALEGAGITQHITASRVFVRPPTQPGGTTGPSDHGVAGAT